jgi:hypothetical protein
MGTPRRVARTPGRLFNEPPPFVRREIPSLTHRAAGATGHVLERGRALAARLTHASLGRQRLRPSPHEVYE